MNRSHLNGDIQPLFNPFAASDAIWRRRTGGPNDFDNNSVKKLI